MQEAFQTLSDAGYKVAKITRYKKNMPYTFKKPYNDPQNFYWFENGFSKQELDRVLKQVDTLPFHKASTFGESDKSVRSSSVKWIPQTDEWAWLYTKLMEFAEQANNTLWNFDLVSAPELIQYTEYYASENGHYDWHQDIGPNEGSLRKVSITVQLSDADEYEGGDLELWQGGPAASQAPRGAGVVFIFPSYMMHRVTPVTKGTRKSFVLWVGGEHFK
jgi:PKHD-type hydroxylase